MRQIPIELGMFDPAKHLRPTATEAMKAGTVVATAVGFETYTVSPADTAIGYYDGLLVHDVDAGEVALVCAYGQPVQCEQILVVEKVTV